MGILFESINLNTDHSVNMEFINFEA